MKIDYELAKKIGATHYSTTSGFLYKFSNNEQKLLAFNGSEWIYCGSVPVGVVISTIKPMPPKQGEPESDYDRGMRKAMQAIAKSCGKVFGADVGYEDLPALVESLINPPKSNQPIPPKPPVTVEYEKVTESIFDLKDEFERGELHYNFGDDEWLTFKDEESLLVGKKEDNVYRRIEKPVDWRECVSDFLVNRVCVNYVDVTSGFEFDGKICHDEFLEMCRVALRANGEL